MKKNIRVIIGIILLVILVTMGIFVYMNRDVIFKSTVTMEYPDGCIEVYENRELITEECSEGRNMADEWGVLDRGILPPGLT